jgi:diguanylate cyclase (GGDEF)-like protein/PAS domain S-box-containing protein
VRVESSGDRSDLGFEDGDGNRPGDQLLAHTLAHADTVLSSLADGVVVKNHHNIIVWANEAAATIFGLRPEQMLGASAADPAFDSRHPDGTPFAPEDLPSSRALATGAPALGVTLDLARADGGRVQVEMSTKPLLQADGSVYGAVTVVRDVTAREARIEAIRFQAALLDAVGQAVIATDPEGRITYWNRAAVEMYGWAAEEALGRHVSTLGADPTDDADVAISEALHAGRSWCGELRVRARDGRIFPAMVTSRPLLDPDGTVRGLIGVSMDVSEQHAMQDAIAHQATHDSLTGLPNRAALDDRLNAALARSVETGRPIAVLFIDLDFFKSINDAVGHRAGDAVLRQIARRLAAAVGADHFVARFGGDEFVAIVEDADDAVAKCVAERITEALRQPVTSEGRPHYVTSSIGIALSPPSDPEELLALADAAMYDAKSRGRDRVGNPNDEILRETRERVDLASKLREALESDALALHYQPIVELAAGRVVGLEALCRWTDPVLGSIPPDRFVAVAESTGLIGTLDRWVLRRAAADARTLVDLGLLGPDGKVAVNLSAHNVVDPGLESLVHRAVDEAGIPLESLALEVTETGVMSDPEMAAAVLRRLRERGLGVHVDDFGTGYSSLSYLRRLPISGIKIDRSFIKDLATEPDDLAITVSIIELSRSLGIRTIAEGVETPQQLALLRERGCWAGQGYLWAPALPLPALVDLLDRTGGSLSEGTAAPG